MKIGSVELISFLKNPRWWAIRCNWSVKPKNELVRWSVQIGPFVIVSKRQHVNCMKCGEVLYYDRNKVGPHPCANKKNHD